jgi:hypothetical protein
VVRVAASIDSGVQFGDVARVRRALPVFARLRSRLFGNPSFISCAAEVIELAPASNRFQHEAIALPGEFDRVIAVQEDTSKTIELERLRAGQRRHAPTMAYRLDNAVLGDGTLYFSGGHQVIRGRSTKPLLHRHRDNFAEMQLCTDYYIDRYFGHWATDGLVLELLAHQRSTSGLKLAGTPWMHEGGYRELCNLKITRSQHAQVERLWVIDDGGINDGWVSRMQELRRRIGSQVTRNGPKRVMLSRGRLGAKRKLINSGEVYEALARIGFEMIDPELEAPRGLVEKLGAAEIAIGVEGSAQNHCYLAMPARSTVLLIQPPNRFNANGKRRADAIGINWGYVVADPHPDGFRLPVDRLLRTIDEAGRVSAVRSSVENV